MTELKTDFGYFNRDCLAIVAACADNPDMVARVAVFVELTIRQWFWQMPAAMATVDEFGAESKYLFGAKRAGYRYIQANKQALLADVQAYHEKKIDLDTLILRFLAIPNLGIVKASFLAQMTVGDGACLDMHNVASLGLNDQTFRLSKKLTVDTINKKIRAYNAVWREFGDSAYWWNSWCDGLAMNSFKRLTPSLAWIAERLQDGNHVSEMHRTLILGE
jgi:hypothetical protein